ncbi:hypothetical protein DYH55_19290 [Methylovirgula sp. 4M-Z18]|nr:hypothetical protein DYH55_19290 [Methylovirgula sp. 4M-Z18]
MSDVSIVRDQVGFMHYFDERVRVEAKRSPNLNRLLSAFKNEFGAQIFPSVIMMKVDASDPIRTVAALGGFRDAISVSAVVNSNARAVCWNRAAGLPYSDAFDVYPWTLGRDQGGLVYALTPGMQGIHDLGKLRPKPAPALPNRQLQESDLDGPLLTTLLDRWSDYKIAGNDTAEHRRLFRALDMARAASKMPGGSDANLHDRGRSVALWVSAFEILAHDGRANLSKVLALLSKVDWKRPGLRNQDRTVLLRNGKRRTEIQTNLVGATYKALYDVRNKFLHGEPVGVETLTLLSGRHILHFAAPMFRLALTAYLGLSFDKPMPNMRDNPKRFAELYSENSVFYDMQKLMEDALLLSEKPIEPNEVEQ